jgi:hypothetical protein
MAFFCEKQPKNSRQKEVGKPAKTLVKSGENGVAGGVSGTDYKNNENNC